MSRKPKDNELPDVEVLGEWDHGLLDPVFKEPPTNPFQPQLNASFQDLKRTVLRVEDKVEGAILKAFHKVEHAVEQMIDQDGEAQDFDIDLLGTVDAGMAWVPHNRD